MKINRPNWSYEDLISLSPGELELQGVKTSFEYDTYGTNYTFQVRILTIPLPVRTSDVKAMMGAAGAGAPAPKNEEGEKDEEKDVQAAKKKMSQQHGGAFSFKGRIEDLRDRPSPHRFIPDPDNTLAFRCDKERMEAIMQHTTFTSGDSWNGTMPKVGDVCSVNLMAGDIKFNLQQAFFDKITLLSDLGRPAGMGFRARKEAQNAHKKKKAKPLGEQQPPGGPFHRWIQELEDEFVREELPAGQKLFEGVGFNAVTNRVVEEGAIWEALPGGKKKDASKQSLPVLKKYWDIVGGVEAFKDWAQWWAWSGVYISHVLRGSGFIPYSGHAGYTEKNKDTGTWKAFSLTKNHDRIKINVGDIVIKPRDSKKPKCQPNAIPRSDDPCYHEAHGDLIYKIENNTAHLGGGNVGNTAIPNKRHAPTFKLNDDGTIKNRGEYIVILKKMR